MRKKIVLGTILMLSVLIVTVIAALAPAVATSNDSSIVNYGTGARATFLLPSSGGALAGRPTSLSIEVWDFDRRSETGPFDFMQIQLWVPGINTYLPIAAVMDIPVPDWFKKEWNATVVSFGNAFYVAGKELEVWVEEGSSMGNGHWSWDKHGRCTWVVPGNDVLYANLTKALYINRTSSNPLIGNLSFTLPPTMMVFVKTAEGKYQELVSPLGSGWTQTIKETKVPAWVEIIIPSWVMIGPVPSATGHLSVGSITHKPPAS